MASVRDIQFFNTLLKASEIFYKDKNRLWAPVTWNGRNYYIYKKPALKLFRFLMPQFRIGVFKDDDNLVKYLYERKKSDSILVRLTLPSPEKIITDEAHNDFEKLADLSQPEQEQGFNRWLEKHTGEKEEKIIGGGGGSKPLTVKEEKVGEIEEKKEQEQQPGEIQIPRPPTFRPPIPEGVKTAASEAQIGARNLGQQAANSIGSMAKDGAASLLRGGGSLAARAVNAALQAGIRAVAALAAGGTTAVVGTVGGALAIAVVLIIAVLVLVPMFQGEVKNEALLMTSVAQAAPITGSGGICPSQAEIDANKNPSTCHYFGLGVDLFDTNISQSALDAYINRYASTFTGSGLGDINEFRSRVNLIVSKSKSVGLNPAIFLGYWKTESLFGTIRNAATFGCAPGGSVKSFEQELNCAVGLNPSGNGPGGAVAAKCASATNPKPGCGSTQIKTFDEFAENYGPKASDINNCTHTYNILVEVAKELNACKVSAPPISGGIVSCPVNGGSVNYGSKGVGGHCSDSYGFYCVPFGQAGYTGRDTAVDIIGPTSNVYLPNIGGKAVEWTVDESGTSINDSEGGGIAVAASTSFNGHTYRIRMVHIVSTGLGRNLKYKSGILVGGYNRNANHVHVTLQEDGVYKPADLYFNLCK
jgi:hypothetical protein